MYDYASTEGRQCKPFNPLLGETYEADYPDKGVRFFSENVSFYLEKLSSVFFLFSFHCGSVLIIFKSYTSCDWYESKILVLYSTTICPNESAAQSYLYSNLKGKFWGRSIQLDPVGVLTLQFEDAETFQWNKVTTSIYNIIIGKIYCDHYGTMRIKGSGTYSCKLKFKEQSIIVRNPHQVGKKIWYYGFF